MKTGLLPFKSEMIPEAGKLLAERHACNRQRLSLLPARFEDPDVAAKAVEAVWKEKLKNGYAAFRDGRMIAYLIGETTTNPCGRSGYAIAVCYTNWISPNLLASRFWPRFGFKDAAYRLAKMVSPMIAWAKDE